jgi:hypothetical protein
MIDPRIKNVKVANHNDCEYPEVILQNVWNEEFCIEYVLLPNQQWADHAVEIKIDYVFD